MSDIDYKTYIVRCKLHGTYVGFGLYKHCATTKPSKKDLNSVCRDITKCAINLMGFKHKLDYKKSYPGRYSANSDTVSKTFEGYGYRDINAIAEYTKERYPIDVWASEGTLEELKVIYDHEFKDLRQNSLIAFITVDNLELAFPEVLDEWLSYEWFCKDWGGVVWLKEHDEHYFDGKYSEDDLAVIDAMPIWLLEELEKYDLDEGILVLLDYETIYGVMYTINHFSPSCLDTCRRYDCWEDFVQECIECEQDYECDTNYIGSSKYRQNLRKFYVMGKKFGYIFETNGISPEEAKRKG